LECHGARRGQGDIASPGLLYSDYDNPIMVAWNWSFFPLDIILSLVGLSAVHLAGRNDPKWQILSTVSLSLTFCAGFMALSFWVITGDFELTWWAPNLYFAIWPVFFLRRMPAANSVPSSSR